MQRSASPPNRFVVVLETPDDVYIAAFGHEAANDNVARDGRCATTTEANDPAPRPR